MFHFLPIPPRFRMILLWVALAGLAGWVYYALHRPRPEGWWHRGHRAEHEREHHEREEMRVTGTVVRWTANRTEDVDGLLLKTERDTLLARFPAYTAARVTEVVSPGERAEFTLKGHPHRKKFRPYPTYRLEELRNPASGQELELEDLPPPPKEHAGEPVEISLQQYQLKYDHQGKLVGLIGEGRLFVLRHRETEQLPPNWYTYRPLVIQGLRRRKPSGFINLSDYELVHCTAIAIAGKTYLLR